jgi:hypothetical protein
MENPLPVPNFVKNLAAAVGEEYLFPLQAECIGRSPVRRGEESPDSAGQDVPWLTREPVCDIARDGKCHRNDTASIRRGKGEMAG